MLKTKIAISLILSLGFWGCVGTDDDPPSATAELSSGTYEYAEPKTFTEAVDGFDGTGSIKGRLTLNADKTFLLQGYLTVDGSITDLLSFEGKGNYSQSGGKLILSDRLQRLYQSNTKTYGPWATPTDGPSDESQIRNVTSSTFQEYNDDDKNWMTWSKI
jgi:hypothetical protein